METRTRLCVQYLKLLLNKKMDGLIAEFGCNSGITTVDLATLCQQFLKRMVAFDGFIGLPYPEGDLATGECTAPRQILEQNLEKANLHNVEIVEGMIEDTIQAYKDREFLFSFLDMDLHQTTKVVADFVVPRTIKGGIIAFHDYAYSRTPGIKLVVDEYLDCGICKKIYLEECTIFLEKL